MRLDEAAAVLGVHPDTPIETIKQKYRRLALAWHPDKVLFSLHTFSFSIFFLLYPNNYILYLLVYESKCQGKVSTDINCLYEVSISKVCRWKTRG